MFSLLLKILLFLFLFWLIKRIWMIYRFYRLIRDQVRINGQVFSRPYPHGNPKNAVDADYKVINRESQ